VSKGPGPVATALANQASSLNEALGKNEHVKELVEESARDLSSANAVLKEEVSEQRLPAGVQEALEKSEAAEDKVVEASEKLAVVNVALEGEVRSRMLLDQQLAEAVEQEKGARHAALHDALTGLPNRALFQDRLEHGLAQAKRHGWSLALLFLDLDDFKVINDTHGHEAGDAVLCTVATRLAETTRSDDTVARHGGDEFVYILSEGKDEANITSIAQKLIRTIEAPCEIVVGGVRVEAIVGASIGISMYPKDGVDADVLLRAADRAMYLAKQQGAGFAFSAKVRVR
jgi:diguanylate cyclase (GGDEF)-like protein